MCTAVDTHGPRVSVVLFTVISSDSSLDAALVSGSIQAAEWTFTATSYGTITSSGTSDTVKGSTGTYDFDGIAFNTVRPYLNNVYFRQAMAYLTSESAITTSVCSGGAACTADVQLLPCPASGLVGYPGACYAGPPADPYTVNVYANAYKDLVSAGLTPSINCAPAYTTACMSSVTNWYVGSTDITGAINNGVHADACPTGTTASYCAFNPTFYWRSDDPLRTEVATLLCETVQQIGFHFLNNCATTGISGSSAGSDVYGPSESAVVSPGAYNGTTGYNSAPMANSTIVNGTATTPATDSWDMYTFGWVVSSYYTWTTFFFNTEFYGTDNFIMYYNPAVDWLTNNIFYGTTANPLDTSGAVAAPCNVAITNAVVAAEAENGVPATGTTPGTCSTSQAASILGKVLIQQLPYLNSFYEDQLWAVYQNGWTGYANEPSTGPSTGVGLPFTLLNVHAAEASLGGLGCPTLTSCEQGGVFQLALHEIADTAGMNPLYETEWAWQGDVWGAIYDAPLGVPPTGVTTPNCFINWMTNGTNPTPCTNLSQWVTDYSTAPTNTFTTGTTVGQPRTPTFLTPLEPGWFQFQNCSPTACTHPPGAVSQTTPSHLENYQKVTLNFRDNITFSDDVKMNALDFEYSLYAWDVTGDSGAVTPLQYEMSGPAGLIACYVPPTDLDQITCYIGSESVWNLDSLNVAVLPMHILDLFYMSGFSNSVGAVDITQPYRSTATNAPSSTFCPVGTCRVNANPPAWVNYLPNLEVGSGPFYLFSYNSVSGAGELLPVRDYPMSTPVPSYNVIPSKYGPKLCSLEEGYQRAGVLAMAQEPCNGHEPGPFIEHDRVYMFVVDYENEPDSAFAPGTILSPPGWTSSGLGYPQGYLGINAGTGTNLKGAECTKFVFRTFPGPRKLVLTLKMRSMGNGYWYDEIPRLPQGDYESVTLCHWYWTNSKLSNSPAVMWFYDFDGFSILPP